MRLLTNYELKHSTIKQLTVLMRSIEIALQSLPEGSDDRRDALANLVTIRWEIQQRRGRTR